MTRKAKLAIQNLSYCGGCDITLADLGTSLVSLLDVVELTYAPLLTSAEDYGDVDVLLLTGAVRTEEDVVEVRRARERARRLVAFGACAAFGGIPGLANLCQPDQLLQAAYRDAPSLQEGATTQPHVDIPPLVGKIKPIDEYVHVDFTLPGCPPPPAMIVDFLQRILAQVRTEEA